MSKRLNIIIAACAIGISGVALAAATLADFKEAANKKGRDSIPYSNERGDCKTHAGTRDDYCKGGQGPWSCGDLNPAGLLKQIDNVTSKIADLKRERHDLSNKRNSATDDEKRDLDARIKQIEDEIYKLTQLIDEWCYGARLMMASATA